MFDVDSETKPCQFTCGFGSPLSLVKTSDLVNTAGFVQPTASLSDVHFFGPFHHSGGPACSSVQDMYRYRTQCDGADSTPSMAFCARGVALGARPIYPEFQTQGGGPLYCRNHPIC